MFIPQACASVITSSVSRNVGQSPCITEAIYTYMWHTCKSSGNLLSTYIYNLNYNYIFGRKSITKIWDRVISRGSASGSVVSDVMYIGGKGRISGVGTVQKVGGLKLIIHKWVW